MGLAPPLSDRKISAAGQCKQFTRIRLLNPNYSLPIWQEPTDRTTKLGLMTSINIPPSLVLSSSDVDQSLSTFLFCKYRFYA